MKEKKSSDKERELLPSGTNLSVIIHTVFDTGVVIDASSLDFQQFRAYAGQTVALLQEWEPKAKWFQEDASTVRGSDDPIDFLPSINLSYLAVSHPELVAKDRIDFKTSTGVTWAIEFAAPIVYFHSFSTGVASLEATFHWDRPSTPHDLQEVNDHLLAQLGSLVEKELKKLISLFSKAVHAIDVPIYIPAFTPLVQASQDRDILYWSHFVYVAQTVDPANIQACATWLSHIMLPTDQQGVINMAIKPRRYIYFGSGRSLIVCPTTFDKKTIYAYARMIELRNYLWKTLFDLDRGLQSALKHVKDVQNMASERESQKWTNKLRSLDFRVKSVLDEATNFKVTFDQEKIWLIRQMDVFWNTEDIIKSVQERLGSFCDFYEYTEEFIRRKRERRLQSVLNLIAVIATSSTISSIIGYLDPNNTLPPWLRLILFLGGTVLVAILFYVVTSVLGRRRDKEDW